MLMCFAIGSMLSAVSGPSRYHSWNGDMLAPIRQETVRRNFEVVSAAIPPIAAKLDIKPANIDSCHQARHRPCHQAGHRSLSPSPTSTLPPSRTSIAVTRPDIDRSHQARHRPLFSPGYRSLSPSPTSIAVTKPDTDRCQPRVSIAVTKPEYRPGC